MFPVRMAYLCLATLSLSLLLVRPIETATNAFKSVHNMSSITIHETGDSVGFVTKHISKSVRFHHILTVIAITTAKIAKCQV